MNATGVSAGIQTQYDFGGVEVFIEVNVTQGDRSSTVVKVLCYKSKGRWFDSRWCHWNFSLT